MTGSLANGGPTLGDQGRSSEGEGADEGLETILLPIGFSDEDRIRALADATAQVAGPMRSTVHVLHVFTIDGFERIVERLDYDPDAPPDPSDVVKRMIVARDIAQELASPFRNYGVKVEVEGRVGKTVGKEIVAAADELDAARIVVGGRRRSPAGKVLFGSTAQTILLDAPCPVTFVPDS